jgi:hypothetical protein
MRWATESFLLRVVALLLASGVVTDVLSHHSWAIGWHGSTPPGRLSTVLVMPVAIVWGAVCAIFLVKSSPRSFLSEDDMSEDPLKRRWARDNQIFFLVTAIVYSVILALPIIFIAWGLNELGLKS